MTTTLFYGGPIRTAAAGSPVPDWVLVAGGRIAATGRGSDRPAASRTVDLGGRVLVPAFCDAHVHLPATGLKETGMSFRGERSTRRVLAAFAGRAGSGEILFGGDFEDPLDEPLTASSLDSAVGGQPCLLARADMHSVVVSTALLRELDLETADGVERDDTGKPTGYLRERAAGLAWRWLDANLPRSQQRDAIRRAVEVAYAKGVATVHEMHVVEWRGWSSLETLREALADASLRVLPYVATEDVDRVAAMGLKRWGGDLFLDGSFGSCTAWLSRPYESPPGSSPARGMAYRTGDEVTELLGAAQRHGLRAGVHAIGDAAIEQALTAWEAVGRDVGAEKVRSAGHRIEHFECATDDHIERAARLGLGISAQPAFDRLWGGDGGMYAERVGAERALEMNRFGSMVAAGLTVGAGSDSTVTPLDPFLQMSSLRAHHVAGERLDAASALRAHTVSSHALAGEDAERGTIETGRAADLAVLDRDPLEVDPDELLKTEVLQTWIGGKTVWPEGEAETP